MTSTNQAAWLDGPGQQLRVGPAEMPKAGEGEIVISNGAVAINPVSWKIQDQGLFVQNWPAVLDYDVAGEVHEVGAGVDNFRRGDRVVAWLQGPTNPDPKYAAYQLYSVAHAATVARLPSTITFTEACVLPTAFNTALIGLCGPAGKGFWLPIPSLEKEPAPSGKTVVIWGASSSVGTMALQLARAAGIKSIAVASAHNSPLCTSCGAVDVLDYHNPSIIRDIVQAVKAAGGAFVGILDCVSLPDQSLKFCIPVLEELGGGELGILLPDVQPEIDSDKIKVTHILGMGTEVTYPLWKDWIMPALMRGVLKCAPEALVVGEGLEALQKGLDVQRKGVSAKKVVVTL